MSTETKAVRHYEIRDDLPMPKRRATREGGPHTKLQPGQGFTVPINDFATARNTALLWAKMNGIRIKTAKIDAETGGIWRVE